jgi:hypothetical protein
MIDTHCQVRLLSDAFDVDRALSFLAVLHFESHKISLHQRVTEPGTFDITFMKEDVVTILNFDESKPLCNIEQLHSTLHRRTPLLKKEKQESPSIVPGQVIEILLQDSRLRDV